jgi:hypothetical protein
MIQVTLMAVVNRLEVMRTFWTLTHCVEARNNGKERERKGEILIPLYASHCFPLSLPLSTEEARRDEK